MEISGGIDICQMSFPTGATAILLLVCILSLLSTKCPAASILRSARFSSMQTTKKPHGYHKIAVWQKDDRIRKSPLKFYVYHYSEPSGDCQASIFLSFRCLIHETQVNHRVRKERKYRITLCCSLILTFIEFITWHYCKELSELGRLERVGSKKTGSWIVKE